MKRIFWGTCFLLVSCLLMVPNAMTAVKKGGTFYYNLGGEPTTLNPLDVMDGYAAQIFPYVVEGLLERDIDTWEWKPALAESWKISKDHMSFEFTLRKGVLWHDGKELTAEDVAFSYKAILDERYRTQHLRAFLGGIKKVEVLDKYRVKFSVRNNYYYNFDVVAGTIVKILPKHIYENTKDLQKLNMILIGTGPYQLENYQKGKHIILKKNSKWWGSKVATKRAEYNFEKIFLHFIADSKTSLEMLRKGELDYLELTPDEFKRKTVGKRWEKTVVKKQVVNKAPRGYSYVGWNLKHSLFKDKKVRIAMMHLFNRELMNKKFSGGMMNLVNGPVSADSSYASPSIKQISFDPKQALKILQKEGWRDSDGDHILDKKIGKKVVKFEFTILEPNKEFGKYLNMFKEDAKKIGVQANIQFVDWGTLNTAIAEGRFDAVRLAWAGGSPDWDPRQIWHSAAAKDTNFISYSNNEVDRLIDQASSIYDRQKREIILHKVYEMISADMPYAFLFSRKYDLYGHSKRIKMDRDTHVFALGNNFWWIED